MRKVSGQGCACAEYQVHLNCMRTISDGKAKWEEQKVFLAILGAINPLNLSNWRYWGEMDDSKYQKHGESGYIVRN